MKRTVHKACLLSAVMIFLLLAAPITAFADSGENELTQTVDGYQVTLVFEEPVASGENPIHIRVSDAHGEPVSNALVEVAVVEAADEHEEEAEDEHTEAATPAPKSEMGGMEGMSEQAATPIPQSDIHGMEAAPEADAASEPAEEHDEMEMVAFAAGHEAGEYEGEISVAGAGEWVIRVHMTVDEHLVEFDFPLHMAGAQTAGRNILLGFFGINAVILGAAFILKFKSAAA